MKTVIKHGVHLFPRKEVSMRRREAIGVLGTLGVGMLTGCGRGTEVDGSTDAASPVPVNVVSGRTGLPIQSLSGMAAVPGQALLLEAPGFFSYRTSFTGRTITLWPADDGFLSAHHSRRLVYRGESPGKLTRLPASVVAVSLVPDEGVRAFPWAMDRIRRGMEILSQSHDALDFAVDGGGFPINLSVNFADPGFVDQPGAAALAYTASDSAGVITGVRIVLRSLQIQGFWHSEDNFQCAVTHECIHGTGLDHSDPQDAPGIMTLGADSYRFLEPSEQERLIMAMQYRRHPGSSLDGMTESDPATATKSQVEESVWRLVCVT
jgi:hypothetical protein